jgi:hypothetical protein
MKKFSFVLLALAHAAHAQPSTAAIEQEIIYGRAQDQIKQSYDRMKKQQEAPSLPTTVTLPEPMRPLTPATTPSDLSVDRDPASSAAKVPSVDSSENRLNNMGECNRRIFLQRRVIENQRRKILELQQELNRRKQ